MAISIEVNIASKVRGRKGKNMLTRIVLVQSQDNLLLRRMGMLWRQKTIIILFVLLHIH